MVTSFEMLPCSSCSDYKNETTKLTNLSNRNIVIEWRNTTMCKMLSSFGISKCLNNFCQCQVCSSILGNAVVPYILSEIVWY